MAEDLAAALDELGVQNEVVNMEEGSPELLDGSRTVIVCTATERHGELPDNSLDFYGELEKERPDFGGVVLCVCGLGDDTYPDFCEASRI